MEYFILWSVLVGGELIGLIIVFLMFVNGCIVGISGILGGLFFCFDGDSVWWFWFIGGMFVVFLLVMLVSGLVFDFVMQVDWWVVILGGLLVGVGMCFGLGCIFGYGVCGLL